MSFEESLKKKQKKDARDVLIPVSKAEPSLVTNNDNTKHKTRDVTLKSNTTTEQETETLINNKTVLDVKENLLSKYEEKSKKLTVEETHTRSTFLFRNDLSKRLDELAKGKRGFKTMFLNEAIESLLDELEKK
ncbi:hypothetical protein [Peribacillus sp. R9-11]|uniref:hypothetical protein n=1 Tax=Peribacillus sp. R9-11 TaxID=3073271 RepID=UPI0028688AA9|nr:hypothetical protein [Peribacillus sp. R9-11]WMX58969.1 hypothetical protein RE409_30250 [Peribacillus sp. R9-11]